MTRFLHVAPEPALEKRLRTSDSIDYLSVDAQDPNADQAVDLMNLPFADGSFDAIHCSHVLEHVDDDSQAMRELRRVLSPRGWATILVPIWSPDVTVEDPSVRTPEERDRVFGQWDHVRKYGPDFTDRLEQTGFSVDVVHAKDLVADESQRIRESLADEEIFFCRPRG